MDISLSGAEIEVLARRLKDTLANLREEIGKTENYELRQTLHGEEAMLAAIVERLENASKSA